MLQDRRQDLLNLIGEDSREAIKKQDEILRSRVDSLHQDAILLRSISTQKLVKDGHCFEIGATLVSMPKILNEILVYGKSPSSLSLKINKDRTTISKHLSELKELGLVVYTTKGRKSIYEATEPIKIRMEIEAIPKGER